jgi:hypothetical protein
LFFYNSHLDNVNSELLIEIDEIREDQKELSKDEKLQVLALLEENKNSIAELTKRTKVTEYIKHLDATALKYKLTFE